MKPCSSKLLFNHKSNTYFPPASTRLLQGKYNSWQNLLGAVYHTNMKNDTAKILEKCIPENNRKCIPDHIKEVL